MGRVYETIKSFELSDEEELVLDVIRAFGGKAYILGSSRLEEVIYLFQKAGVISSPPLVSDFENERQIDHHFYSKSIVSAFDSLNEEGFLYVFSYNYSLPDCYKISKNIMENFESLHPDYDKMKQVVRNIVGGSGDPNEIIWGSIGHYSRKVCIAECLDIDFNKKRLSKSDKEKLTLRYFLPMDEIDKIHESYQRIFRN